MLEMIHMSHVSSDRVMPSYNVHHQAITPFEKPPASSLASFFRRLCAHHPVRGGGDQVDGELGMLTSTTLWEKHLTCNRTALPGWWLLVRGYKK
jgi:hypothetical protein